MNGLRFRTMWHAISRRSLDLKIWGIRLCHRLRDARLSSPLTAVTPVPPTLDAPHWGFGQIWVDDHGHVHVHNPPTVPGLYPVIVAPDPATGISLHINGLPTVGSVVVQESDQITLTVQSSPPQSHLEVSVDAEGLQAWAEVTYQGGEHRRIRPTAPQWRVTLTPEIHPILPEPLDWDAVQEALDRADIRVGRLPQTSIQEFLDRRQSGTVLVAQGVPASPGTPHRYEPLPLPPFVRQIGSVTWEEPAYARLGATIGRWHPGQPPQPGVTVWGTVIDPPVPDPHPPRLGEGVTVMADQAHLVATRDGRIHWTPDAIDIIPELRHADAVVGQTLTFDGDILIHGSISRGATVVATGNLVVIGDVEDSELVCAGTLRLFGDARHAQLSQGLLPLDETPFRKILDPLDITVTEIDHALQQLHQHLELSTYPFPSILQRLLQTKFPHFSERIRTLQRLMQRRPYRWDPHIRTLAEHLHHNLGRMSAGSVPDYRSWADLCQQVHHDIAQWQITPRSPVADAGGMIRARNLTACRIRGQGPILVQRATACTIETAAAIEAGQILGGRCQAGHRIIAHRLGSVDGVPMTLTVEDPQGQVQSQEIYPPADVQVGDQTWSLTTPLTTVILSNDS